MVQNMLKMGYLWLKDRRRFFHETNFFRLFLGRGIQKNWSRVMKTQNEERKFYFRVFLLFSFHS